MKTLDEHSKFVLRELLEDLEAAIEDGNRYFTVKGEPNMLLVKLALDVALQKEGRS